MRAPPAYDAHADWYERYVTAEAATYRVRVTELVAELLGPGAGACLDLCCGNGIHAPALRDRGWRPVGVDLSSGQLRHATGRLPVAQGDATALPVATGRLPAVVCVLAHTDLPDYPAVLREAARVLRPGGRFVHAGVHPCFVGAFADRSHRPQVVVDQRYADRSHSFDAWCPRGVRARVGAWHLPLGSLLNAVMAAGLRVLRVVESPVDGVPDTLGLLAIRPGHQ